VISIDWTLGLQFVNFIVLLIVLNKLLYKPLHKILAERREKIDGSHQHARDLEASIEAKMQEYQNKIDTAKALANEERNKLKKNALEQEASILSEAHAKSGARLQTIKSQIANEASEAGVMLKKEAENLAGLIATKILGRELL
jgi:F-type H+-transporting ATPase subunit b